MDEWTKPGDPVLTAKALNKILVTGGAGFIGSHLVDRLVREGCSVTVVDNFDPYYPREEKLANLAGHLREQSIRLIEADISDPRVSGLLPDEPFDAIVHLAALAGVRPSLERPADYQRVNVVGTAHMLDYARRNGISQFVFASSSSVYGNNPRFPWSEEDADLHPISPYAVSKLSAEMLGHVYASLFGIRFLALRLFTVYGPRQRPDLAIRKFAHALLAGQPITLYGTGTSSRDYTFVHDTVAGICASLHYRRTMFEVINLGNSQAVPLLELVRRLEQSLNRTARLNWLPVQPGDVEATCADIRKAQRLLGYAPATELSTGLASFAAWFQQQDRPRLPCPLAV